MFNSKAYNIIAKCDNILAKSEIMDYFSCVNELMFCDSLQLIRQCRISYLTRRKEIPIVEGWEERSTATLVQLQRV